MICTLDRAGERQVILTSWIYPFIFCCSPQTPTVEKGHHLWSALIRWEWNLLWNDGGSESLWGSFFVSFKIRLSKDQSFRFKFENGNCYSERYRHFEFYLKEPYCACFLTSDKILHIVFKLQYKAWCFNGLTRFRQKPGFLRYVIG